MFDLVISIINHSNPEMLRNCLGSLFAGTRWIEFEVWVIDNATDGRLVDQIRDEFPSVRWLFNDRRLGFSANHNQVLGIANGRYICILNDDTLIEDGAMEELVRYMDRNPRAGMCGPRVLNADGSIQNSTFRDKTLLTELIDICLLPRAADRLKAWGIHPAQFGDTPASVPWLLGACIVVRQEPLREIGLLDDELSPIANCEEVDWCHRARKANWQVVFVPTARITHYGGQSLKWQKPGSDFFRVEMHRVMLCFFRKHHGEMQTFLLRLIYVATLPWNGFMLLQSVLRGRTQSDQAKSAWATLVGIARVALRPLISSGIHRPTISSKAKQTVVA